MVSFILMMLIYFFIVGFLTILERKILGLVQGRLSLYKNSFLSLYHFYLDFLKVFLKGAFGKEFKRFPFFILLLVGMIFFNLLGFYFLIFGFLFKNSFFKILIIYLLIEGFVMVLKILVLNFIESNFISYTLFRVKGLYIILEGLFSYIIFLNLIILNYMSSFVFGYFIVLLLIIFITYILVLLKLFRTPFDFVEVESELTGGAVLEFQGISFLLWSLFEYSSILNSHIFITYILGLFIGFYFNNWFYIVFTIFLLSLTFFIRGVFLRLRYSSTLYLTCFLYFIINLIFFLFWIF